MGFDLWSVLPWLGFHVVYRWTRECRIFRELERSQWWPREKVEEFQWGKLKRLLRHSYETVPLYMEKFEGVGLRPDGLETYEEFRRLPILTKDEIRDRGDELVSAATTKESMKPNETGGSTGHPLVFYQDGNFRRHLRAELLRNYVMAGYKFGGRVAFLWGSEYDLKDHTSRMDRARDRVTMNIMWIDTFNLMRDEIPKHYERLVRFRPQVLVGFRSSLVLFARYAISEGERGLRPGSVQSSSETLTSTDRELMREAFGCEVFNRYGCHEVGNIAHECEAHEGLHVLAENVFLEVLDSSGEPVAPAGAGVVVVTNLNNYGMPFIRYRNEDVVVPSGRTCSCGRGLPLIERVEGRTSDVIVTPAGGILHGETFTRMFSNAGGIHQFQVVQESVDRLEVKIVPGRDFDSKRTLSFLEKSIHGQAGEGLKVDFRLCDSIEPSPSGKHRYTISKVPVEF